MTAKKQAGAQPGNQFGLKWTESKREILCQELMKVAKDEVKLEYTLKQICYRAGYRYKCIEKVHKKYSDVSRTWEEIKSILQKRWLDLAIGNNGNGKVVSQFLGYHSQEVTEWEDDRELNKLERSEKIKGDEKIRCQYALIKDTTDIIIDIVSETKQAIQERNAKNKRDNA